jgi:hypothetical protein
MKPELTYIEFLGRLRHADPTFAEVSILRPPAATRWQASVFLLTGSAAIWDRLGSAVITRRSVDPVIAEAEDPTNHWGTSDHVILTWVAYLCGSRRSSVLPYVFDRQNYERWLIALHLLRGIAPGPFLRNHGP